MRRVFGTLSLSVWLVLGAGAGTALAEEMPTFEDDPYGDMGGDGFGSFVAFVFLLAIVAAIGTAIYRVSTARSIARDAGLDPDRAATMALISDDGLDATYLAASLRAPRPDEPGNQPDDAAHAAEAPTRTARERLEELASLHGLGLITDAELAARRDAILGEI